MFKKKQKTVVDKTDFPDGFCVETERGSYYIKVGRYKFVSKRAKESWNLPVIKAKFAAIEHIPLLATLGFRDGTMIEDFSTRKLYLISKSRKWLVDSPDTLGRYGLEHVKPVVASAEEVGAHRDGGVLK